MHHALKLSGLSWDIYKKYLWLGQFHYMFKNIVNVKVIQILWEFKKGSTWIITTSVEEFKIYENGAENYNNSGLKSLLFNV